MHGTYQDGQYIRNNQMNIVSRRKNLSGLKLRASLVVTNNDTLNHLDDY